MPARSWKSGFPGLPGRFEWFAIDYQGVFKVIKPGRYTFRLVSDDGSKLLIDDSLVINNDGLHGVTSRTGAVDLDDGEHRIRIQYMQGPRWSIALQLFAKPEGDREQIFPATYFSLQSPEKDGFLQHLVYLVAAIVLVLLLALAVAFRKKRRNRRPV